MIMSSESASLVIIDRIEALIPAGAGKLTAKRLAHGTPRESLVDERDRLVAIFAAGVPARTAEAAALLLTHAHVLTSLARLGLAGSVVAAPRPIRRRLSLVR